MTTKQQTSITMIAVLIAAVAVIVLIVFYARMKQSIKGALSGNYFSDDELIASETAKKLGLDNTPSEATWKKLHALRDHVLNPAREQLGSYIRVNCAYRSEAVNAAVGGVSNSQHKTGEAADITAGSKIKNRELFKILVSLNNYDQLIWEKDGSWIHVSHRASGNRGQILAYNGSKYVDIKSNWEGVIA